MLWYRDQWIALSLLWQATLEKLCESYPFLTNLTGNVPYNIVLTYVNTTPVINAKSILYVCFMNIIKEDNVYQSISLMYNVGVYTALQVFVTFSFSPFVLTLSFFLIFSLCFSFLFYFFIYSWLDLSHSHLSFFLLYQLISLTLKVNRGPKTIG